jgi:putative nucleotidyltransferase with HDIG domain
MKHDSADLGEKAFLNSLMPDKPRLGPLLASAAAFFVTLAVIVTGHGYTRFGAEELQEFEAGKVADRDITAAQAISYIDEEATRISIESREKQVPAVFVFSERVTGQVFGNYDRFIALTEPFFTGPEEERGTFNSFRASVEAEFPGSFSRSVLEALYDAQDWDLIREYGKTVLGRILETGVFALPSDPDAYNRDFAELYHNNHPRLEREQIRYDRLITMDNAANIIERYTAEDGVPLSFSSVAAALLMPFLSENVFFSPEDTLQRLAEVRVRTEPVVKYIERGKMIIRKGFVVTEEDMKTLRALSLTSQDRDPRAFMGQTLVLLLLYALLAFLTGKRTLSRMLGSREIYLLCVLAVLYISLSVFIRNFSITGDLPVALFLPSAVVVMLPYILIGARPAVIMALVLPLASLLVGAFDIPSYIFALTSGLVAVYTLRGTTRRLDLVKAGLITGAAHCVAAVSILLTYRNPPEAYPAFLFWAAFNGAASGILALGLLPWLENILNAVTTFRLMELSDLNSPILKRLFNAAPGTYSHSLMVATLAEAACQEIGANSLLARVGAYYHDIGKMDNPGYFVENQTVYNKHDDIAPRLSATVIRSHVKLGVEKARQLGLPREVTDIIAEHHGNSVITWFYHAALKKEAQVNKEDFSYPGAPPRTRESAVVMLADVTEAAVRTLKKPSVSRLEKFVQELIMAKFEHGQLSESELTFRDLETIKKAFVRVLAGHYHARIDYPKTGKDKETRETPAANAEQKPNPGPDLKKTEAAGEPR